MTKTHTTGIGLTSLVIIFVVLVASLSVGAQDATSWGDPDLQGIWSNQTPIPLERPQGPLAGKLFFTEEEAAEFEDTALAPLLSLFAPGAPLGTESALSGELSEIWLETQDGRVAPSRRTSLVADPPDGRILYTPEGRTRWEALPTIEREIAGGELTASGPEDRTQGERCLATQGLLIPNPFYNNHHHILQIREYVAILTENLHVVRIIPLDQRPHLGSGIRLWEGDSRNWWEGQALVVETTNFNDKKLFRGATEHLRLVERFTRLDGNTVG